MNVGLLVDGQWQDRWYQNGQDGAFERQPSQRRYWVSSALGADFAPVAGRYHLYVSLACPWAHRTLIARHLKGLEPYIGVSVVSWLMGEQGWTFAPETGSSGDTLYGLSYLHQLYTRDAARYSGRVTVPVLWDRERQCIVNNESADILRMFNDAFDTLTGNRLDLYPAPLRSEIDTLNERIYPRVNNGVYRAGFATAQQAYEEAFGALFDELAWLDGHLGGQRYLAGDYLTEADLRLFTTLIRFDAVYHGHFKCNAQRVEDYRNLSHWLRELYQWPGVADTVNLIHIKRHYYGSHPTLNPNGIVPKGPTLDFNRPHDRARLPGRGIWQRPA
nr:glutathione S-transferase family protein [Pseudomonas typographi]